MTRLIARLRQLLLFLLVGSLSTAVNATIFYAALQAGLHYQLAMAGGFISGSIVGYSLNSRFTFLEGSRSLNQALRYLAVNLFSLAAGSAVLFVLVEWVYLGLLPASVLVIVLTTGTNYFGCRSLVFTRTTRARQV